MAAKITYLVIEDFNQRVDFTHHSSECKINALVFRKGNTFFLQEIKQVLDTCNKYTSFDINTLIVKGESDLTIWIEEKSQRPNTQNTLATATTQPNSQSLPTKTVTKRYRGQVYEEKIVDCLAIQQNQPDRSRRKYRGRYID
ncbi:MAG: hypothetical protein AAGF83_17230 [Cyanobacteria bacterium P01_G01_bin.67]